jgi:hypothetical protein
MVDADYVLPTKSYIPEDDTARSYGHHTIQRLLSSLLMLVSCQKAAAVAATYNVSQICQPLDPVLRCRAFHSASHTARTPSRK